MNQTSLEHLRGLIRKARIFMRHHQGHHPTHCSGENPECDKEECGQNAFSKAVFEAGEYLRDIKTINQTNLLDGIED